MGFRRFAIVFCNFFHWDRIFWRILAKGCVISTGGCVLKFGDRSRFANSKSVDGAKIRPKCAPFSTVSHPFLVFIDVLDTASTRRNWPSRCFGVITQVYVFDIFVAVF